MSVLYTPRAHTDSNNSNPVSIYLFFYSYYYYAGTRYYGDSRAT